MAPVKAVARVQKPLPAVDGLCAPSLEACQEEPCWDALPMPMIGGLAFLDTADVGTLSAKDLPTPEAAFGGELPGCKTRKGLSLAWAQHAPGGADGTPGRLQALLVFACGLVSGREGYYPSTAAQLLVYDGNGKLELSATPGYAALYEWRSGDAGPELARGFRIEGGAAGHKIEEGVAIARR